MGHHFIQQKNSIIAAYRRAKVWGTSPGSVDPLWSISSFWRTW